MCVHSFVLLHSTFTQPEEFRNYGKGTPRYEGVRAFYDEQHEKQTYEFASTMLKEYTSTSRCTMPVWDALMYVAGCLERGVVVGRLWSLC